METKLDSRQAQFPATFPDTFKDFFAMMSEDEEHLEPFSNLLEDKIIPRTVRLNQRRCGGSLRCTSNPNNVCVQTFGRSNSFRVNRPVVSNNCCRHVKYCCINQKSNPQQQCSHDFKDFSYRNCDGNKRDGAKKLNKFSRSSLAERSFESESCEESDTMSTTSSTTATIPYGSAHASSRVGSNNSNNSNSTISVNQRLSQGSKTVSNAIPKSTSAFHAKSIGMPRAVQHHQQQQSSSRSKESNSFHAAAAGSSSGGAKVRPTSILHYKNDISADELGAGAAASGSGASSSMSSTPICVTKCFSEKLNCCSLATTMRSQKSPILNRRRSSSIAATLLTSDSKVFRNAEDSPLWIRDSIPNSSTRELLSHEKSPINSDPSAVHSFFKGVKGAGGGIVSEVAGAMSFKQTLSGALSPQYTSTMPAIGGEALTMDGGGAGLFSTSTAAMAAAPTITGKLGTFFLGGSSTITTQTSAFPLAGNKKQRPRTSSMPAENRKPRLADTRRAAIHCADMDIEYYRLRSFSITSHGICNLGDSMRSRRSRSINSVTSTGTSNSERDRNNSNASGDFCMETEDNQIAGHQRVEQKGHIPAYKIAILGASGVGKTALTYQFTTSDYICAYDLSLDDDYGQKTVSVLLDGMETDLEVIDHPACEMSTEAFCSTYNIDLFVVVYSVVDRNSLKAADRILHYLKDNEMLMTRGAILVGNKTDLERHREVTRQTGRRLAKEIRCKFIETSSGLDHNVDELLVGIVAQVKLNSQRIKNLSERDRQRLTLLNTTIQKHRRIENPARKIVKQKSVCKEFESGQGIYGQGKSGVVRKVTKRTLNLESILKVGESELDDEDDDRDSSKTRSRLSRKEYSTRRKEFTQSNTMTTTTSSSRSRESSSCSSSSPSKKRESYEKTEAQRGHHAARSRTTTGGCATTPAKLPQIISKAATGVVASGSSDGSCNNSNSRERTVAKLSNRTKIFLTSILKFKRNLNVKRRSSSSCSDLFVI